MAPHLREIDHLCDEPNGCPRRASLALVNSRNAVVGYYCRRHGPRKLKELLRQMGGLRDRRRGPQPVQVTLDEALAQAGELA